MNQLGWVCGAEGGGTLLNTGFTNIASGSQLSVTTSSGEPAHTINAWVDNGAGYAVPVASAPYVECSACGNGSDGSWSLSSVPSANLPAGEYNFTDFTLGAGTVLTFTPVGATPVILRVTGDAVIDGEIVIEGSPGGEQLGGVGGPGGSVGGNVYGSGNCSHGTSGVARLGWTAPNSVDSTVLTGGGGGGGNTCNNANYNAGGGGGGGAIAIFARTVSVAGEIDASGGAAGPSGYVYAGGGAGGGIWLRGLEVSIAGILDVSGGSSSSRPGESGVVRIDSGALSYGGIDSAVLGIHTDIPPKWHIYQSMQGDVFFANNGLGAVSARLSALE